ncbi:MarC family protein [Chroococcus sp. FPU101]|uniref:MarC family protein n=1 Tax=Chroococcus sp. FPU101 TaxID=1974212 RepID=UPI001A8F665C|nr:MarC family protein [Chroococcus sp. FPU101]GFE67904.1 multiple antibiotic resistance (MarC)-related protein [Chroococcus sp. FPU101]
MYKESFIFTIFFLTLGPIKIISAFGKLTQGMTLKFKREVAIKGILIALAICLYVSLLGEGILKKYQISLESLEIAGGIVLLLSALKAIFPEIQPTNPPKSQPSALQLAISPVASPIVVPPVGVAAILIFVMLAPRHPGMGFVIAKALLVMLLLDFLVMFFIDQIIKVPGLMLVLQVLGSVLVFVQVALAIEAILEAFRNLGVFKT